MMRSLNYRDLHFVDLDSIPEGNHRLVYSGAQCKLYAVFDDGRLWSVLDARYIDGDIDRNGYRVVTVGGMRTKMHRLLLYVFRGPSPRNGMVSRHFDGNPSNNHIDNLAWGTQVENWDDKRQHGTATVGERSGAAKLRRVDVAEIRNVAPRRGYAKELATRFGVSVAAIQKIRAGEIWK